MSLSLSAAVRHLQTRFGPSAIATVGMWECDLVSERLTWSDGVYDLFDLPRGAPIERAMTVGFYDAQSRIEMECLRTGAVRDKSDFSLDARIRTALGADRWIRITAQVGCVAGQAVRLFGAKHDVTQEHQFWEGQGLVSHFAHR